MPTGPFPERFLKCVAKEDRKPLGKAGETIDEATARASVKLEREMHDQFAAWLRINGIHFIHTRMDKKSTMQKGWPDFTLIKAGRAICVEFKLRACTVSEEQSKVIRELLDDGTPATVSLSVQHAIEFTREHFPL